MCMWEGVSVLEHAGRLGVGNPAGSSGGRLGVIYLSFCDPAFLVQWLQFVLPSPVIYTNFSRGRDLGCIYINFSRGWVLHFIYSTHKFPEAGIRIGGGDLEENYLFRMVRWENHRQLWWQWCDLKEKDIYKINFTRYDLVLLGDLKENDDFENTIWVGIRFGV